MFLSGTYFVANNKNIKKDLIFSEQKIISAISKDKKNVGKDRSLVVIDDNNKMHLIKNLSVDEIRSSLVKLHKYIRY